jgi:opacity protein-like surface antigen
MGILRALAASGALVLAANGAALAADLGAMPEIPTVEDSVVEPEFGSNWYLRGDIGYASTNLDLSVDLGTAQSVGSNEGTWDIGGGVGYDFGWFRSDVTVDWVAQRDVDVTTRNELCVDGLANNPALPPSAGGPLCSNHHDSTVQALPIMLNAYFDLGSWSGFAPYVGAGVGAALVSFDDWRSVSEDTTAGTIGPAINDQSHEWRFAWSLMAGLSYHLNQNLALDIGYRYLNINDGKALGNFVPSAGAAVTGGIGSVDYSDFYSHQVRVGFRYTID